VTAIRFVIQSNYTDADARLPAMLEYTSAVRQVSGCQHAEDLRSTEFPGHLLHLELWDSATAFDEHWQRVRDGAFMREAQVWQAPNHGGLLSAPRLHGQSGIEVYRHAPYAMQDNAWQPVDESLRSKAVLFPAWGPVRILINGTSPADSDPSAALENARQTRLEPGCLHFENFRGVEYPENTCLVELWTTPQIYDAHWLNRLIQRANAAPGPRPAPMERRHGSAGFEWYTHCFCAVVDGMLVPEDPALRMTTVRW
jgi:quinol monooxygenase YgiN